MSKDRHERAGALFLQVRELPVEDRASVLDDVCGDDSALRAEVEFLLKGDVDAPTLDFPLRRVAMTQARASYPAPGSDPIYRFVPGRIVARRYRMVGVLGRGGMGEVYRADDIKLGQPVALKFLPPGLERDPGLLSRFLNEVKVALKVTHPNVCRVYDLGELDDQYFISMEYIDGGNLAALLKRVGRLPGNKALQIAGEICAGLAAAHDQRILHRDLKPANIMLDGNGRVKITDFGLASIEEAIQADDVQSGTPAYMSPEQLAGQEVTIHSDIYALGLVLYELFTGQSAFSGKTPAELAEQHREVAPEPPSHVVHDLDPVVEQVIDACLKKKPADRPTSVLAVAEALPGADPLEAALAAGETPSPEMVAAASNQRLISPRIALTLMGSILLSMCLAVWLADHIWLSARTPLPHNPQALARAAADIARTLGHDQARDVAYGFQPNYGFIRRLAEKEGSPTRWAALQADRPPAMFFWYRRSPAALVPLGAGPVSLTNPQPLSPGMLNISLDPHGRLLMFISVPGAYQKEKPVGEADWSVLFEAADLDMTDFAKVSPRWQSPVNSDRRAAWKGTPGGSSVEVRVEAAAIGNEPVAFRVFPPRHIPDRPSAARHGMSAVTIFQMFAFLFTFGGAALLASAHIRHGRGDRQGALRVGMFLFTVLIVFWSLMMSRLPHHAAGFLWVIQRAVGMATWGGLMYFGIEPYVRKRWPQLIISWSRMLGGRWRDPLVARDILIGLAVGLGVPVALNTADVVVRMTFDMPAPHPASYRIFDYGARQAFGYLFMNAFESMLGSFCMLVAPLVIMLVLRKFILAMSVAWMLAVYVAWINNPPTTPGSLASAVVLASALLLVTFRWGLLASILAHFGMFNVLHLAGTTDVFAWNGRPAVIGLVVTLCLALHGLVTCLAGRRRLKNSLLAGS